MDAPIKNIKEELQQLSHKELLDFSLRILKYKKENKELAYYLLFEKQDEDGYAQKIINILKDELTTINFSRTFFARKGFKRVNRLAAKYLKYSGDTESAIKVYLFLAKEIAAAGKIYRLTSLTGKLVEQHNLRTKKMIASLHEDLQFDYENLINNIKP